MHSRTPRTAQLGAVVVIAVAMMGMLGGCASAQMPTTSPPAAGKATGNTAGEPAASSPAPSPSSSPLLSAEPASSFESGARTLRSIAEAPHIGSRLSMGRKLSSRSGYTSHAATYTSDGLTIAAIVDEPSAPGRHPAVVLVHGFVDPGTYVSGGELQREQDYLARAGYVVLYTDLRGLGGSDPAPSGPPDLEMGETDDVINAVTALATSGLPGLDPNRIGLFGHSLGGLLVLNVLVTMPGLVDAAVVFAPSGTDRWADVNLYLVPGDPIRDALIAAHGTPTTNPGYWADVSPRTFVDRVTEPLLMVQGDADVDVPPAGTIETFGVWRRAGKDVALQTLKGEGHVFAARRQVAMDALTAFFANHLK